jgi:predicted nucleotidyltransferase
MLRADAIALLLSHADEFRSAGVAHVSLFGSVARDEAGDTSDVDLVLDGPPERPMNLFSMARAERLLERILGRRVDLTARQGLDNAPDFRERVVCDIVRCSELYA